MLIFKLVDSGPNESILQAQRPYTHGPGSTSGVLIGVYNGDMWFGRADSRGVVTWEPTVAIGHQAAHDRGASSFESDIFRLREGDGYALDYWYGLGMDVRYLLVTWVGFGRRLDDNHHQILRGDQAP